MRKYLSRKYGIQQILFINGAIILALELLGTHILAPFVGTTIAVWSAVIGVILLASSIGYYIGGLLADRRLSNKILGTLSFEAGLFIILILPLKSSLPSFAASSLAYSTSGLLAALLLFALPTIFLSMVTTYAIRLKVKNLEMIAATNGKLYGVSTAGSLAGVFFISFFFIPNFNVSTILVLLGCFSFLNTAISMRYQETL